MKDMINYKVIILDKILYMNGRYLTNIECIKEYSKYHFRRSMSL